MMEQKPTPFRRQPIPRRVRYLASMAATLVAEGDCLAQEDEGWRRSMAIASYRSAGMWYRAALEELDDG